MADQQTKDSCLGLAERVGLEAIANGSNFVFSPLSIRAALSLVAVGSKEETLDRMLSFLGSGSVDELNADSARLLGPVRLSGTQPGSITSFVNGIWVDRSLDLNPVFKGMVESIYRAAAISVDFQAQAVEVAKEVNGWVEKETNGLIKDLLPDDSSVDSMTRLIIANALYFKGTWEDKFDASKTRDEEFHLLDGSTIKAPFMTSKKDQFISSFDGFQVLRLPYRKHEEDDKSFSMYIYLPNEGFGLHRLLDKVANEPGFIRNHTPRRVEVGRFMIPKFKISYGFEASEVLKSMGLELPFCPRADFTGMTASSSSDRSLFISSVHHKATIELEEEGTVASAATAVVVAKYCCYVKREDFVADHPFMFVIREDATGSLLFLGFLVNPLLLPTP